MSTISAGLTHVGRHREQNEDSFVTDDDLGLYAVSDGMGGHAAGEVASKLAIDTAYESVQRSRAIVESVAAGDSDPSELVAVARAAVDAACKAVFAKASANPALHGMGCTLTLVLASATHAALAHVGDSRLYLIHAGRSHQLSSDHTVAADLWRAGVIEAEKLKTHPYAHALTRALGSQEAVAIETLAFPLFPGDCLVLCSDGLSEYLDDPEWFATQVQNEDLSEVVDTLVDHANASGGRDNITTIVARVEAELGREADDRAIAVEARAQMQALRAVPAFKELSLGNLSRVLNQCSTASFAVGDSVFSPGSNRSSLAVVLDGSFSLEIGGTEVRRLRPGDCLGASALLAPRKARSTLRAAEDGQLLLLEARAFERLTRTRPWLGVALLSRVGRQTATELDGWVSHGDAVPEVVNSSEVF